MSPANDPMPAEQIVERLVALHRLGELRPGVGSVRDRRELALVGLLEGDRVGVAAVEVRLDPRIVDPGIEIGEIPFRQLAEPAFHDRLVGELGCGLGWRFRGGLLGGGALG